MAATTNQCAWCGSPVKQTQEARTATHFCPECQQTFETEAYRSLHPMAERLPYND